MRTLLLVLACLFLWHPAVAQDQHVLFLGNSYTAGNDLASIVDGWLEAGVTAWPDVRVERNTPGGYRLPQHLADAQGANAQVAAWLTPGAEPWATVVLQDQSQVPGFYSTTPVWIESRDAAVVLHGVVGAAGADTMLFLTWGRRVGDDTNPELFSDFTAMQDRLTAGYLAYATAAATPDRPVFMAPVGEAFRAVHDRLVADGEDPTAQGSLFWDLYVGDGSHPSELGSYLAGAVFFAALTGRSPVGLQAPPSSVTGDRAAALQQIAEDVVRGDPFGEFRTPWAWDAAEWTPPTDVQTVADLVVSAVGVLPLVRTGDESIDTILVGAAHEDAAGSGRLLVAGALTAGTITLAEGAGSDAELSVTGSLSVQDVRVGAGLATVLAEGDLMVAGALEASFVQSGGVATLGTSVGAWTMNAGAAAFSLAAGREPLRADGPVVLGGTIRVTAPSGVTEATLLRGPSIDVDGATFELPAAWDWELIADGDGQALRVADTTATTGDDDDAAVPACGCAQASPARGSLLFGLILLMGAIRSAGSRTGRRG